MIGGLANNWVTDEDRTFYDEHGWWVSGRILPDALLDELSYAVDRYALEERDRALPVALLPHWSGNVEEGVRQADYLSLQLDAVMDFVVRAPLPEIAAALCGTKVIRLFHDQLVWKDPSASPPQGGVGWHTDKAYWRSCTSERMLTAWIPLQDTSAEMGTLAVWDGSHHWTDTDDLHTFDHADLSGLAKRVRAGHPNARIRVLPLSRGQVSFHHCRLVHGSYPNRSEIARIALAVHYQDGDNRHAAVTSDRSDAVHLNDLLCRRGPDGLPDYTDPEICPILYAAPQ